jgi:hypothetical protein
MNNHFNSFQFAALLSTLAPLRIDAGRCTVASRLRRQPFGCGIRCQRAPGRSVTSPHLPSRVVLMGQHV